LFSLAKTSSWARVDFANQEVERVEKEHQDRYRETGNLKDLLPFVAGGRAVYATSLDNEERCVTAGACCEIPRRLIGQRIAERTHRLATAGEIEQYQQLLARNKQAVAEIDARSAGRNILAIEPLKPAKK
jgi:hypothetical protein